MSELKPCPFCGGEAEEVKPIYTKPGTTEYGIIRCIQCGVEIASENGIESSNAALNRRAQPANEQPTCKVCELEYTEDLCAYCERAIREDLYSMSSDMDKEE